MPQQPSPPYLQSLQIYPQHLDRWDAISAQGGKLERIKCTLTIPAFSFDAVATDYGSIKAAYNFEAPNNFSIKDVDTLTAAFADSVVGGTYNSLAFGVLVAISWYDTAHTVHRYELYRNPDFQYDINVESYNGQKIAKNFRLEFWNSNIGGPTDSLNYFSVVLSKQVTIMTSVLGTIDYRYGTDASLVNADSLTTNFNAAAGVFPNILMPLTFPANATSQPN